MTQAKRARQRANREAKQAAMAQMARRRKIRKQAIAAAVVVVAVVLVVVLVQGGGKPKKSSAKKPTTSTTLPYPCTPLPTEQTGPKHWSTCPPMTIVTSKTYTANVTTDVGSFTITLDPKSAPVAVNNFVFLAKQRFYNGVEFQRVIPGFMMQGGDPTASGAGGPGYEFTEHGPPAASDPSQQYPNYSVAMANSSSGSTNPNTNGSQFFVVDGSQGNSLPPDYVLFGKVTSGMSVVDSIVRDGSPQGVPPTVTHKMITVTVSTS